MNTLQLQDSFEPYYAEETNVIETKARASADVARRDMAMKTGEMRARLKEVRDRLAQAIAKQAA